MITIGFPDEWKRFADRHPEFLRRMPALIDACNAAFKGIPIRSLADGFVFGLARVCADEFWEIFVLAGNGYGTGAGWGVISVPSEAHNQRSVVQIHPPQIQLSKLLETRRLKAVAEGDAI
jgi:hypothetical protein